MDRRTLIAVSVLALLLIFWQPLMRYAGLGRYIDRSAPTAARDTTRAGSAAAQRPASPAPTAIVPAGPRVATASAAKGFAGNSAERIYWIETPLYRAQLSNRGARVISVELLRYASAHGAHSKNGKPPRYKRGEIVPPGDRVVLAGDPLFAMDLGAGAMVRSLADVPFAARESLDAEGHTAAIEFSARDSIGMLIRETYRVNPGHYGLRYEVHIDHPQGVSRVEDYSLTFRSWPTFTESEHSSDERALRAACQVGSNVKREGAQALLRKPAVFEGNVAWAGVQSRYFMAVGGVLQGPSRSTTAYAEQRPLSDSLMRELKPGDRPLQTVAIQTMVMSLPGAAGDTHEHLLYFGPSEYGELSHYPALSRAVELGWTWILPISGLLLQVLNLIHRVVGNYGFAILLLATLIRAVLHPLNMTSMRSMRAMQRIQPELDRLREKYKNDASAMNTAMMALYKENKVNPAGGCLPMLIQMPVLIALYQVLFNAIELRQAPFIGWITDLSAPDLLFRIGPLPVRLLPILMAGSGLLQQRMTPTPPQQAPTAYMMNVMMLWFFYGMPSGLVLYWTVMNLLSALQQWMVLRGDSGPAVVVREVAAEPPARRGKSGRGVAGNARSG